MAKNVRPYIEEDFESDILTSLALSIDSDPTRRQEALASARASLLFSCNTVSLGDHLRVWVPGHFAGNMTQGSPKGPVGQGSVMIVGKAPGRDETGQGRYMVGSTNARLFAMLRALGLTPAKDWYYTSVLKYNPVETGRSKSEVSRTDLANCLWALQEEVRLVKPKFILLLGSDAVKTFFGRSVKMEHMRSSVLESCGAKVVCTFLPSQLIYKPEMVDGMKRDLSLFAQLVSGKTDYQREKDRHTDVRVLTTEQELSDAVLDCCRDGDPVLSIDTEWGGKNWQSGYLRTIQFTSRQGMAYVVHLTHPDNKPAFPSNVPEDQRNPKAALPYIKVLFDRAKRLVGQNIRADIHWLEHWGVRCKHFLADCFDTMLAEHVLDNRAPRDLTALTLKYTEMDRYDGELYTWLDANMTKDEQKLHAFGKIPDHILLPYAGKDVDATWRVWKKQEQAFAEFPSLKKVYEELEIPVGEALFDMEHDGMDLDVERYQDLGAYYMALSADYLAGIRKDLGWDDFNPGSSKHKAKFLFEDLKLPVYKTTPKKQPSTDADTLEHYKDAHPVIPKILDYLALDKVGNGLLQPAQVDKHGNLIFKKGLMKYCWPDGRVRTQILQWPDTGRYSSRDPNLQNLPKKVEKRLARLLGKRYKTVRSVFLPSSGCVYIEADFSQAELRVLAALAGDEEMAAILNDPSRDLHSETAAKLFGLDINTPDFKDVYEAERIQAKAVNFSIPYGTTEVGLAKNLNITEEEAKQLIVKFFEARPKVGAWIEKQKKFLVGERMASVDIFRRPDSDKPNTDQWYIPNAYGRIRRWFKARKEDMGTYASIQREAVNCAIQGTVADALTKALIRLKKMQKSSDIPFRLVLTIHDAVIVECREEDAAFVEEMLRLAMSVEIPYLDQYNRQTGQFFSLPCDTKIMSRWGELYKKKEKLSSVAE